MSGYDTDIREFDILSENEKNLLKWSTLLLIKNEERI